MSRNESAQRGRRGGGGASELAENPAQRPAVDAGRCPFRRGVSQERISGVICPSVCPSDWDKRETLVVSRCIKTTCDERFRLQRRGQDSNLRTSFPVTDLANPRYRPLSHLSVIEPKFLLSKALGPAMNGSLVTHEPLARSANYIAAASNRSRIEFRTRLVYPLTPSAQRPAESHVRPFFTALFASTFHA